MRTAIFFLIGVALVVLVGSFVPQEDTSDQAKVDQFLLEHANLNSLATHLGLPLTQVFVSPIFLVLLGSLYIALGACVLRRLRALIRRTRGRYRRTPQFWGEWGSWLFHTSFFVLLVAVVWGKATGFQGIATITEGQTFTQAPASYDTLQEGVLFRTDPGSAFQVRLDRFRASYAPNGEASDYVSDVTIMRRGQVLGHQALRVNDPVKVDGVSIYQQDYGWAPVVEVRNPAGAVVFQGPIQFFGQDKSVQTGVLKVPDFGYTIPGAAQPLQLGARMAVFPDAVTSIPLNSSGSVDPSATTFKPGGMEARNPVLQIQLFLGDLGLAQGPQNVNQLQTSSMQPYFSDAHPLPLRMGESLALPLPGAVGTSPTFSVRFTALRQYSLVMVKRDDGVPLVYGSFAMLLVGLLVKLYARPVLERRRSRAASRTAVVVGRGAPVLTRDSAVLTGMMAERHGSQVSDTASTRASR